MSYGTSCTKSSNGISHSHKLMARRPLHDNGNSSSLARSEIITNDSIETDKETKYTQLKAKQSSEESKHVNKRKSILLLAAFFLLALSLLYVTYRSFPQLQVEEKQHIKLPRNLDDAKQLGLVLTRYRKDYYTQVLAAVAIVYIFLQTFAIPGSIFLSILSGYLFPFFTALALVCLCSALGATCCYGLTQLVGRRIVMKYWPHRIEEWCKQVDKHREHMLYYIIFLRITPFLPNWFINIASPVINVQLFPFALGTFIGVAPPSFIFIQAGTTLYEMTESTSTFTWGKIVFLATAAMLSLLPVFLKKQLRQKLE